MKSSVMRLLACALLVAFPCSVALAGHGGGHGGGHHGGGHGGGHHGGGHHGGGHHGEGHHGGGHHGGGHHAGRGGHHGGHAHAHAGHAMHGREAHNRAGHNHWHGRNAFGAHAAWNHWGHNWNHWGWGWPYFWGDVLSFVFWPYAVYNPFWFYGPDFILETVFWPGPYGGYGYARPYDIYGYGGYAYPSHHYRHVAPGTTPSPAPLPAEACTGLAPGVTDLPIDQIARAVHPTGDQIAALDELKTASAKAADVLKASCPTEVPLTPVARLDALEKRLDSMLQAVQIVRDPLRAFYNSLSDEQKQQFEKAGGSTAKESTANELSNLCSEESANFTQLPTQAIEQSLKLNTQQTPTLDQLSTASSKAAIELEKSCPTQTPQNPADRLDAITKRLNAMIQAVNTIRPALNNFYASLNDDQKARFNVMQQPATAQSQ